MQKLILWRKLEMAENWILEAEAKIRKKLPEVVKRSVHKVPYTSKNGVFDDWTNNIAWWTNGFWGGILWQLYHVTKDEMYRESAKELEEKLDATLMSPEDMDHDSGFRWLLTSGANFRETGKEESYRRTLLAACNMAGRFNPVGNYIRAWNDWGNKEKLGENAGIAIIDCMMNLPLLYWASEQTKDPRFYHIAVKHADTVMEHFIREDGSVIHIGEFDPYTGEFLRSVGGQGYAHGSAWTRGQAWAIYGFVLSYQHTKKEKYLECAQKIADYFISNIPQSGLIPVDFCQPGNCGWEDSTAAAIAACGMLEIAKSVGGGEDDLYRKAALKLLYTLYEKRCDWSPETDAIIQKCTAAYHDKEHEFTIIYGDYFFIEAIWKLTGQELFLW
ncbi:MAG: glycoside hydrolase family 88 protein [Lachnospiraceae bacterium]|nr:glycoside hydrolase family 88 protein [Lachnospiraceae bacterium]